LSDFTNSTFDKSKDAGIRVLIHHRQRLRFGLRKLRGEPRPLASAALVPVGAAIHDRTIAVVHGRGVNAVFVLAAQGLAGPLPALVVRTPSAPPSSAPATGGFSWSCVHSPLKLLRTICKILPIKFGGRSGSTFLGIIAFCQHSTAIIPRGSFRADHPAIAPPAVQRINE
jgi:hypothetical protein